MRAETLVAHPDDVWRVRMATWALMVEGYAVPDVIENPCVPKGTVYALGSVPDFSPRDSGEPT